MTESWVPLAVAHLRADPILGPLIGDLREPELYPHADLFQRLVEAIIAQQLSTKAAATIEGRFVALFPEQEFPTALQVAELDVEVMRGVGLSRPKASYLKDLAARCLSGAVELERAPSMSEEELVAHLTQIKGIGPWTVDMLMIFALHRPDVLPLGDLGIRKGFERVAGRELTFDEMREMAEPWRPYRSAASWYLWRLCA